MPKNKNVVANDKWASDGGANRDIGDKITMRMIIASYQTMMILTSDQVLIEFFSFF